MLFGDEGIRDAFYPVTQALDYFGAGTFANRSAAAWIADNWTKWGADDVTKGEAQRAIWKMTNVMDITEGSGLDHIIYNAALSHRREINSHWYFAYSVNLFGDATAYQDYLTPAPVPEPSTLLVVGSCFALMGARALRKRNRD